MKKFTLINENIASKLNINPELEELQNDLIKIIDDNVTTDNTDLGLKLIQSFIEDIDTTIIGLINDSDVFDFYIKHRNQIDSTLSDNNHFNIPPSDLGTNSIYDYIIKSTKISIQENFKKMLEN